MAKSKSKGLLQKIGFIRDYLSLAVSIAIVFVAVIFLVIAALVGAGLIKKIETESISKRGRQIKMLSKNSVPNGQGEIERLYQKAYEEDANRISDFAVESSQRSLLSYKIFPEPLDKSSLIFDDFGEKYRSGIDGLIERANGRDCPTSIEIDKALKLAGASGGSRSRHGDGRGSALGTSEVESTIMDALCRAKARITSVYINPDDLAGYQLWEEYNFISRQEAIMDCWSWQLGYWIIEDVLDTTEALNARSKSILTSPVKRLVRVGFSASRGLGSRSRKAGGAGDAGPAYVTSDNGGLTNFFTERFSDDEHDVIHFNVVAIVGARDVPVFMKKLCSGKKHEFRGFTGNEKKQTFSHNQITILESKFSSIDREDPEHELYRYGDEAVVEIDLICEYLFNKPGYSQINPNTPKETTKTSEDQYYQEEMYQ